MNLSLPIEATLPLARTGSSRRSEAHPDAALLAALRGPNPARREAENAVYAGSSHLIRADIRRYGLSPETASMAYSDAVLTALEHAGTGRFEGHARLKTYLHGVFSHKCLDARRQRQAQREEVHRAISLDSHASELPDPARSALQQLAARQEAQHLHILLDRLEPRSRAVLLGWGAGYSDAELARQLGYGSAGVVKTSRFLLLEKLRGWYGAL